ncbi:MAG: precorrin-2 dehydrogenase/sirohydrochlorin ferrochelatase family protein [Candidatus Rokuibacteriota bacterium]
MSHYPVVLDLAGRPVLVVGGGAVGERKVEGLLAAGARVTVVAPRLTARLAALAGEGRLRHVAREYRAGDVDDHVLVFVAVGDEAVAHAVRLEARARRVWTNVADDPARCDFILPSVLRRGELVVAVTTGGASPALARAVRERLESVVGEEYGALTALVADVRRELRAMAASPEADAWNQALGDDHLSRLVREGRSDEARRRLRERLGAA